MRHDHDIVEHAWHHHHEIPQAPGDFRRALGCFATGVTVVTTVDGDGRRIGLTANSFSSVSIDPPLILWSLARRSPSLSAFEHCRFFAVNVLAGSQQAICTRFATPIDDRFSGVDTVDGQGGVPLISGALAQFECENEIVHAGGDHAIFIGRVNRFRWREQVPLVFCMGALRELDTNRQER